MNIVLFTNTYLPHVGGVARSVAAFCEEYRRLGHRVLIIAPEFPNMPIDELGVIRLPAIQNFNGSDFSALLPVFKNLHAELDLFKPDIIHSQHPFLIGMTAIRVAKFRNIPIVFTHHTLYEQYTHYVPGDSAALKRFVIELSTHYANLTEHIFAPSESIKSLIQRRGVTKPISVIPTGVTSAHFALGNGEKFRRKHNIQQDSFVVGHVGRLAEEKNLEFLAKAVVRFIKKVPKSCLLVVGAGEYATHIKKIFEHAGLLHAVFFTGVLTGKQLVDALYAMDVFAFTSKSETQGMVLTEAMAASLPVIALDANGVRDVVLDKFNGRLLFKDSIKEFADTLQELNELSKVKMKQLKNNARNTADNFSMQISAKKSIACYQQILSLYQITHKYDDAALNQVLALIKAEWNIIKGFIDSSMVALSDDEGVEKYVKGANHDR
jgi:glycosyltransferase involved in cell wall biosynthesis